MKVSCKIRLLDDKKRSVDLIRQLIAGSGGISAMAVKILEKTCFSFFLKKSHFFSQRFMHDM
jgi:hypothetical protein